MCAQRVCGTVRVAIYRCEVTHSACASPVKKGESRLVGVSSSTSDAPARLLTAVHVIVAILGASRRPMSITCITCARGRRYEGENTAHNEKNETRVKLGWH
jgi:hypothetical protein